MNYARGNDIYADCFPCFQFNNVCLTKTKWVHNLRVTFWFMDILIELDICQKEGFLSWE
jgi:hypothetical protein